MRYINFDEQFQRHVADWIAQDGAKYGNNVDRMEAAIPDVYLKWLGMPAEWLDGASPGSYFERFEDAGALVAWMKGYFERNIPVPDPLMERIADLGQKAETALVSLLEDGTAQQDARLTAMSLLKEIDSHAPMALYIDWISQREAEDERADIAAESLRAMGSDVIGPLLARFDGASGAGQLTFVDILAGFPGEAAVLPLALSLFDRRPGDRALLASCLGRLGDDRALSPLYRVLSDPELSYLDYIEVRNAIEALGGEVADEPIFDGDPYYESLKRME